MEDSLKIQEEFELLVEQLEKLKSINELTSSNSESSYRVISQIENLIQRIDNYNKLIEEKNDKQFSSIQKLVEKLNDSIVAVENQRIIVSEKINDSFSNLQEITKSDINNYLTEFKELSEKRHILLDNKTNDLTNHIEKSKNEIFDNLNKVEIKVFEKLDSNNNTYIKKSEKRDIEIKNLKTFIIVNSVLIIIGIILTILK